MTLTKQQRKWLKLVIDEDRVSWTLGRQDLDAISAALDRIKQLEAEHDERDKPRTDMRRLSKMSAAAFGALKRKCDAMRSKLAVRGTQQGDLDCFLASMRAMTLQRDEAHEVLEEVSSRLGQARDAIESLPADALGYGHDGEVARWPLQDELLSAIDSAQVSARAVLRDRPKPSLPTETETAERVVHIADLGHILCGQLTIENTDNWPAEHTWVRFRDRNELKEKDRCAACYGAAEKKDRR